MTYLTDVKMPKLFLNYCLDSINFILDYPRLITRDLKAQKHKKQI